MYGISHDVCIQKCYNKCVMSGRDKTYCEEECNNFCSRYEEADSEVQRMGLALVTILIGLLLVVAGFVMKNQGALMIGLLIELIGIMIKHI